MGQFFDNLRRRVSRMLVRSNRVHLRLNPAEDARRLIDLIDRFVGDEPMRYELEWDDFISWPNDDPEVEQARQRIGKFELFGKAGRSSNLQTEGDC